MDRLYSPCSIARVLHEQTPLRAEAVLHAWPNDPRDELDHAEWAADYLARWPVVEAMMDGLSPATWTHERMEDHYLDAAERGARHSARPGAGPTYSQLNRQLETDVPASRRKR